MFAFRTNAVCLRSAIYCLALLACLFVLVQFGAAAQETPEATSQQSADQGTETDPDGDARSQPWTALAPCEGAQHPFQVNLCQQWRSAEAAERGASLTRLLMLLSLLAIVLLIWIVVLLFKAVGAVRAAAKGSANTNDGTPLSPAIANREEELRAYIDVDGLEFIETPESEGVVKVKINLRNSGQTPAFEFEGVAEMKVDDISDEDLLPVLPLPDDTFVDLALPRLGRDAKATMIIQCDSTPKLADRVTNSEAAILVWGSAHYRDVSGKIRKTAFQYLCNAETLETGEIFRPMARGDELQDDDGVDGES